MGVLRIREDVHRIFRPGRDDHQRRGQTSFRRSACASFFISYFHSYDKRSKWLQTTKTSPAEGEAHRPTTIMRPRRRRTILKSQPQEPTTEHPNRPPSPSTTLRDDPRYELTHTMSGHTQSIFAVKFGRDGTYWLHVVCRSNPAWSPHTGQPELVRNLTGHSKGLSDIAWSSDSVVFASASDDSTIRIWTVDTVRLLCSFILALDRLSDKLGQQGHHH